MIFESRDLGIVDLHTLFGKLQEPKIELKRLANDEEDDKKKKKSILVNP